MIKYSKIDHAKTIQEAKEAFWELPSLHQAQTKLEAKISLCKEGSKNWHKWNDRLQQVCYKLDEARHNISIVLYAFDRVNKELNQPGSG